MYYEDLYIYDWVWCKDIVINKKYFELISNYNKDITINDNILNNWLFLDVETENTILKLLKNRVLLNL